MRVSDTPFSEPNIYFIALWEQNGKLRFCRYKISNDGNSYHFKYDNNIDWRRGSGRHPSPTVSRCPVIFITYGE